MTEMIERVARSLCVADGHDPDGHFEFMTEADQNAGKRWTWYISRSRSAIEAMRTPTIDMICCGSVEYVKTSNTAVVFTSMIDAALKENP